MQIPRLVATACIAGSFALFPVIALTNAGGAPAGRAGAPGDVGTCATSGCHTSFDLNSGDGSVEVEVADTYVPGEPLDVTVRVLDPGQSRFGFQATVQDGSNAFLGSFTVEGNVDFSFGTTEYVTHAFASTAGEWTFQWTPPSEASGPVTFYVAGNAADGNGTQLGDYVYTATATVDASTGTATDAPATPATFALHRAYPNPAVASTRVSYTLEKPQAVTLTLYDVQGRAVRTLEADRQPAGTHTSVLSVEELAAGQYYYRLQVGAEHATRPLLVLR